MLSLDALPSLVRFLRIGVLAVGAALLLRSPAAAAAETVRDVTMGRDEVHLRLPESFIDSVVGAQQDGEVLLHVRWPSLTGYHDGHERDDPKDPFTYNNMIPVLLTLSDRINPLQERYERQVRFFAPLSRHPSTTGLEHWGKDLPWGADYTTKREIYFAPGEQVETYISCYLPGTVPAPGCTAEFYIGPFLAHASYSRVFLPQWRAIQDGVRGRVLSFVTTGPASHD